MIPTSTYHSQPQAYCSRAKFLSLTNRMHCPRSPNTDQIKLTKSIRSWVGKHTNPANNLGLEYDGHSKRPLRISIPRNPLSLRFDNPKHLLTVIASALASTMASTTSQKHPLLLAAALANGLLAIGHTVSTPWKESLPVVEHLSRKTLLSRIAEERPRSIQTYFDEDDSYHPPRRHHDRMV